MDKCLSLIENYWGNWRIRNKERYKGIVRDLKDAKPWGDIMPYIDVSNIKHPYLWAHEWCVYQLQIGENSAFCKLVMGDRK